MPDTSIKVAMCDDHAMVRNALAMVLEREPDIEIVGSVATGTELLSLVKATQPQVVILDVRLQDESGVELAQRVRVDHPECKIVMLTSFESDAALVSSFEAGAAAFMFKTGNADELVSAVRGRGYGALLHQPGSGQGCTRTYPGERGLADGEA